ncbi:hypothetical protein CUA56_09375, partial [Shigella boydii]
FIPRRGHNMLDNLIGAPPKIFTVAICHESLSFSRHSSERSIAYFVASVNAVLKINAIHITLWVLQFLVF